MHSLQPARLKPGVTLETLPAPRPSDLAVADGAATASMSSCINGR